jgi:hypothetical protein
LSIPARAYEVLTRLPRPHPGLLTGVACVLFVAACALPNAGLLDRSQVGDTPQYRTRGNAVLAGEIPYRDFYVEYPPGALPMFVVPAVGDDDGYATRFKVLAVGLGVLSVALVAACLTALGASAGRLAGALALVAAAPALLGPVFVINFDVWPAALGVAALAAVLRGRARLGHAALGVAVAAKLFPLVLAPVFFLHVRRREGTREAMRALAVAAAVVFAIALPFLVLGPGGVRATVETLVRRPLQIESLGASVLLAAHRLGWYEPSVNSDYNSQNLGGSAPDVLIALSSVALAAALVAVWLLFARRPASREALVVAAAASVCAAVALGKVLSPQFLVWLVPLVPLVAGRVGLLASALLATALLLTQSWFPDRYGDVVRLGSAGWLVLARNLVLVALLGVLLAALRAAAEPRPRRP